jgi:hypothetical protein
MGTNRERERERGEFSKETRMQLEKQTTKSREGSGTKKE